MIKIVSFHILTQFLNNRVCYIDGQDCSVEDRVRNSNTETMIKIIELIELTMVYQRQCSWTRTMFRTY